ncbi:MAG: hypothetical protein LBM77_12960 [Spirochaetaceae bacterium]|jgi:hypothetical protein|nr:hypothetical protein [Spirochaetaceae bacterium]
MAEKSINYLKVRDDGNEPFQFIVNENSTYQKCGNIDCHWLDSGKQKSFDKIELRKRVEPWLTALFQSDHLSL